MGRAIISAHFQTQPLSPAELQLEPMIKNSRLYRLFMEGPPGKGTHTLNPQQTKRWIRSQVTRQRRIAAAALIRAVRYVPYDEFLGEVKRFIRVNFRLFSGPRSVISVTKPSELTLQSRKKSNFWISVMTSSILWHEHGVYVPVVDKEEAVLSTMSHIIDIDDCGYTGNQTGWYITQLINRIRNKMTPKKSKMYLHSKKVTHEILAMAELQKHMTQYHICRIFASSD